MIARYLVQQFYEKSSRQPAFVDPQFLDAVAGSFEARGDESDSRRRALSTCVEKLAYAARQLFWQYYSGTQNMRQLAAALDMTPAAVKQSIYRSRLEVAKCIDRQLMQEEHS